MVRRCASWNPGSSKQFACSSSLLSTSDLVAAEENKRNGYNRIGENAIPWDTLQILSLRDASNCDGISTSTHSNQKHCLSVDASFTLPQLTSLQWQPLMNSHAIAFGTAVGTVGLINWQSGSQALLLDANHEAERICNAIEFNLITPLQLAAAFELSEYGAVVWDLEREAMLCTSMGESSSSLAWLPIHDRVLAVGSTMSWIRLLDTRINCQQSPALSIRAHPSQRTRKIRGIRPDPFRPYVFATFSDFAGDAVKIWDIRKMSGTTTSQTGSKAATAGHIYSILSSAAVSGGKSAGTYESIIDVAWSPLRPYVLAVVNSSQQEVAFYDTAASMDILSETSNANAPTISSTPIYSVDVPKEVHHLSWEGIIHRSMRSVEELRTDPMVGSLQFLGSSSRGPVLTTAGNTSSSWQPYDVPNLVQSILSTFTSNPSPSVPNQDEYSNNPKSQELLITMTEGFIKMSVRDRIPMALSAAGQLACSGHVGSSVAMSQENLFSFHARSTIDASTEEFSEQVQYLWDSLDVCRVMRRRCSAGYSVDSSTNVDILIEELDRIYSIIYEYNNCTDTSIGMNDQSVLKSDAKFPLDNDLFTRMFSTLSLYRTWLWIDRFETTVHEQTLELTNCGVFDILSEDASSPSAVEDELEKYHAILGTSIYESKRRNISKKLCGWINMYGWNEGQNFMQPAVDTAGEVMDEFSEYADEKQNDLLEVVADELYLDSFERAAAVSMWHGRLNLAVDILKKAIAQFESGSVESNLNHRKQFDNESEINSENSGGNDASTDQSCHRRFEWDIAITAEYMQKVSLVAMCIAGYPVVQPNAGGNKHSFAVTTAATWIPMCQLVITQLGQGQRRSTKYLSAVCSFLLANLMHNTQQWSSWYSGSDYLPNKEAVYRNIIDDDDLALEDRIAFSCTYLPQQAALNWLRNVCEKCCDQGILEGVLITGLSGKGIRILQCYIDKYEDIQSGALLICRVLDAAHIPHTDSKSSSSSIDLSVSREWIWLNQYRNLLNCWEMFVERAFLDVELGKRYQKKFSAITLKHTGTVQRGGPPGGRGAMRGSSSSSGNRQKFSQEQPYRLPLHSDQPSFFLRCGGCGISLPVDGMQNVRSDKLDTLRRQKNVLSCCPNCSRQLPRCYVCQLYMGMVNPYLEVNRIANQRRRDADLLLNREAHTGRPRADNRGVASVLRTEGANTSRNANHGTGKFLRSSNDFVDPRCRSDRDTHNVVDFGKWFFFCQHCRHGGHANCIDLWFGGSGDVDKVKGGQEESVKRVVCGVNGCTCRCILRQ